MTTLIQDVRALLNPLAAGGAWYAVSGAQPPVYPYIVFQRVISTDNVTLNGRSDLQNTRMQVDIYSRQITEAQQIEGAVLVAFASWEVQNVPISSQDFFDDTVKAFRISRDFSIWATN